MVGMSKEDRFWFGKVWYRVLEGKIGHSAGEVEEILGVLGLRLSV